MYRLLVGPRELLGCVLDGLRGRAPAGSIHTLIKQL